MICVSEKTLISIGGMRAHSHFHATERESIAPSREPQKLRVWMIPRPV